MDTGGRRGIHPEWWYSFPEERQQDSIRHPGEITLARLCVIVARFLCKLFRHRLRVFGPFTVNSSLVRFALTSLISKDLLAASRNLSGAVRCTALMFTALQTLVTWGSHVAQVRSQQRAVRSWTWSGKCPVVHVLR